MGVVLFRVNTVLLLVCLTPAILAGCSSSAPVRLERFAPAALEQSGFQSRASRQTKDLLTVKVAVLTRAETEAVFGVPLTAKGIQPVWIEVDNASEEAYWLLDAGVDPDYFSPNEAAHKYYTPDRSRQPVSDHFQTLAFSNPVEPGSRAQGFVLTNLDRGIKAVNVDLVGRGRSKSFSFFVPVPDFRGDYQVVDFDALYQASETVQVKDEKELQRILEQMPCCTKDSKGEDFGDPLNLILIGQTDDIIAAFTRREWKPTEQTYTASIWRTVKSFFSGKPYPYSPVSPLYVFGRSQDISGQKARSTIHQRNHLRLWLTPYRFRDQPVWLGQISRDIGIRLSFKVFPPVTHVIDPDVDEARNYIAEDLFYSGALARFGLVKGVGFVDKERPRFNLGGDPYFTDGLRMVLEFSPEPHRFEDIDFIDWERPRVLETLIDER